MHILLLDNVRVVSPHINELIQQIELSAYLNGDRTHTKTATATTTVCNFHQGLTVNPCDMLNELEMATR